MHMSIPLFTKDGIAIWQKWNVILSQSSINKSFMNWLWAVGNITMHLTPIINGSLKNTFINVCNFKINLFGSDIPVEVLFDSEIDDDNISFQFVCMVAYDKSAFDADSITEIDEYILTNAIDKWNQYINEP